MAALGRSVGPPPGPGPGSGGSRGAGLPRSVWALGFVSLFMDLSSEMIHGLLPVFLTVQLGAGAAVVGMIEGVGEATASVAKLFSGWISDRVGGRKWLAVAGYGLAAASKPFFAVAPSAAWVLGARTADRLGKGTRGAPRDALVADLTPPGRWGAAYGLRQALDNVGAFAGPLVAVALMLFVTSDMRTVFWVAVLPGVLAVVILVVGVREPDRERPERPVGFPLRWSELAGLGRPFWIVMGIAALITLARFSEAFLILRAEDVGLGIAFAPMVLVVIHVVSALTVFPIGRLSDRIDRRRLLWPGLLALIVADAVLATSSSLAPVFAGVALWGLHLGLTQGLLTAMIADTLPRDRRGTGFGLFNLVSGLTLLVASVGAGWLWDSVGPHATFAAGAVVTAGALGVAGAGSRALARG